LSQTNESDTVPVLQNFLGLNKALIETLSHAITNTTLQVDQACVPGIEDYRWKHVDKEELLVEPQDVRVLPFGEQKYDGSYDAPLPKRKS